MIISQHAFVDNVEDDMPIGLCDKAESVADVHRGTLLHFTTVRAVLRWSWSSLTAVFCAPSGKRELLSSPSGGALRGDPRGPCLGCWEFSFASCAVRSVRVEVHGSSIPRGWVPDAIAFVTRRPCAQSRPGGPHLVAQGGRPKPGLGSHGPVHLSFVPRDFLTGSALIHPRVVAR